MIISPRDVAELVDWFDARDPNPHVRPVPGYGEKIPVWLLGSSLYSAQLAAQLGLPFAFASHFAPDMLFQALHLYRSNFKPSARLEKPYAMVCINIIAADSNRDAEFLFTSMQQAFVKLRRGETGATAATDSKYGSVLVAVRTVWCAAGAEYVAGGR